MEGAIVRMRISASEIQRALIDKNRLVEMVGAKHPFYFNPTRTASQLAINSRTSARGGVKIKHSHFVAHNPKDLAKAKWMGMGKGEAEVNELLRAVEEIEHELTAAVATS